MVSGTMLFSKYTLPFSIQRLFRERCAHRVSVFVLASLDVFVLHHTYTHNIGLIWSLARVYLRLRLCSVVAKLTLEITGIPELSSDRTFGWPSPTFIEPSNGHTFEVSISTRCCVLKFLF